MQAMRDGVQELARAPKKKVIGKSKFVLHPQAPVHADWELWMTLMLVLTLILLPLTLAFQKLSCDLFYANLVIDLFFMADVAKQFNTGYVDENAITVMDRRRIAHRYVFGSQFPLPLGYFFFDLAASFPYDVINWGSQCQDTQQRYARAARLLKLVRLFRIMKLFRLLRVSKTFNMMRNMVMYYEDRYHIVIPDSLIKMSQLFLLLLTGAHWIGCLQFMIVSQACALSKSLETTRKCYDCVAESEAVVIGAAYPASCPEKCWSEQYYVDDLAQLSAKRKGILCVAGFPDESWVVHARLEQASLSSQYVWAYYKALAQMIVIGFEVPATVNQSCDSVRNWCAVEHWLTLVGLYMGAIFYSLLISNISMIVLSTNVGARAYRDKVQQVNEYMRSKALPASLRDKVKDFYTVQYHRPRRNLVRRRRGGAAVSADFPRPASPRNVRVVAAAAAPRSPRIAHVPSLHGTSASSPPRRRRGLRGLPSSSPRSPWIPTQPRRRRDLPRKFTARRLSQVLRGQDVRRGQDFERALAVVAERNPRVQHARPHLQGAVPLDGGRQLREGHRPHAQALRRSGGRAPRARGHVGRQDVLHLLRGLRHLPVEGRPVRDDRDHRGRVLFWRLRRRFGLRQNRVRHDEVRLHRLRHVEARLRGRARTRAAGGAGLRPGGGDGAARPDGALPQARQGRFAGGRSASRRARDPRRYRDCLRLKMDFHLEQQELEAEIAAAGGEPQSSPRSRPSSLMNRMSRLTFQQADGRRPTALQRKSGLQRVHIDNDGGPRTSLRLQGGRPSQHAPGARARRSTVAARFNKAEGAKPPPHIARLRARQQLKKQKSMGRTSLMSVAARSHPSVGPDSNFAKIPVVQEQKAKTASRRLVPRDAGPRAATTWPSSSAPSRGRLSRKRKKSPARRC